MIEKKVTFNKHNEPIVTITITGYHDVVRFMEHTLRGQVEFGAMARRVYDSIGRRIGAKELRRVVDFHTGKVPIS